MSATSNINPNECDVFVNIWVDVNATKANSTQGIYCVDNQVGNQNPSKNEGSPSLVTTVGQGSKICWKIIAIDPETAGQVSIIEMQQGESGFSHVPGKWTGDATGATWTGQMTPNTVAGTVPQSIKLNVESDGGLTLTINPAIEVYS